MSRPGVTLLFLVIAAFGVGGVIHGFQSKQRSAQLIDEAEMLRTRVGLLEEETLRLSGLVDRLERAGAVDDPEAVIRSDLEGVVSEMRGLEWKERIPYKIVTKDGIADLVREAIRGPAADPARDGAGMRAGVAMGWVDAGEEGAPPDRYRIVGRLYNGEASAFYDEMRPLMYVARGTPLEEASERVLLVHELACALLDQHYDFKSFFRPEIDALWQDSDQALAHRALATGDATILTLQYNEEYGSAMVKADGVMTEFGALAAMIGLIASDGKKEDVPVTLARAAIFPHTAGRSFAAALAADGGFTAIDAAYAHPPVSTAEILHPELFLGGGLQPRRFEWREEDFRVDGLTLLYSDVAGEAGMRWLLQRFLDREAAEKAAEGWRGDRFIVYAGPGGEDASAGPCQVLLRTEWSTPEDAREFHDALGAALQERYALNESVSGVYDGARFLLLEVTGDGTGVIFVDAGSAALRDEIRGRLP